MSHAERLIPAHRVSDVIVASLATSAVGAIMMLSNNATYQEHAAAPPQDVVTTYGDAEMTHQEIADSAKIQTNIGTLATATGLTIFVLSVSEASYSWRQRVGRRFDQMLWQASQKPKN